MKQNLFTYSTPIYWFQTFLDEGRCYKRPDQKAQCPYPRLRQPAHMAHLKNLYYLGL